MPVLLSEEDLAASRAARPSTAPLAGWEHYLSFGMAPRSRGSARRVEYLAGAGAIIGGACAVLAGVVILAVGIGWS